MQNDWQPVLWMNDLLQQAGNKVDILSYHQYNGGDVPSGRLAGIDAMHSAIVAAGYANKPLWITESGWPSDTIGERQQANYLTGMLQGMASRPWWDEFFWYQIWEGPTDRAGLLYQDETPKPSWFAYRDYTNAHPAAPMVSVNLSTNDISDGIRLVSVGDGNTSPATVASRSARRNWMRQAATTTCIVILTTRSSFRAAIPGSRSMSTITIVELAC